MGGLMWLLVSAAQAKTLTVTVLDSERLLGATPKISITDARRTPIEGELHDDGAAPDERAGDHKWTAVVDRVGRDMLKVDVVGSDGAHYRGTISLQNTDGSAMAVRPTSRGQLLPVAVAGAGPPPNGVEAPVAKPTAPDVLPSVPGSADIGAAAAGAATPPTAPSSIASAASTRSTGEDPDAVKEPWRPNVLLGLWGAGLALLGWSFASVRRTAVPANPLRGLRPELPGRGLVRVTGDADKFVETLAKHFRVVLAGRAPAGDVPAGMVFVVGPGRVQVEDIAQTVRGLEGRGPPVVVVVTTGRIEAGGGLVRIQHAIPRLERTLPAGTHCFVFSDGPPRYRVDDAGQLVDAE